MNIDFNESRNDMLRYTAGMIFNYGVSKIHSIVRLSRLNNNTNNNNTTESSRTVQLNTDTTADWKRLEGKLFNPIVKRLAGRGREPWRLQ